MDLIFEEEGDDVGSDIEAYCPKCKGDTSHTVITKYEDEIRRVQCSPCGDVHAYRKPRGEVEDDVPEPIAAKKRAALKKATWQEFTAKLGNKVNHLARPYSIRDHYKENDVVTHPKFGIGFVTEISENKVEITFQDERRVLIHNRPDLAAQMPAIAPMPAPRRDDKRGKKGKKGAAAAPPPPPAKGKAVAAAKPAAAKPLPAKPLSAKVERAKAAAKKKGAAKGKPARAARPAKRAAPRPAARKPRPVIKKKPAAKLKLKAKARKAR